MRSTSSAALACSVGAILLIALGAPVVWAQEGAACLACHADSGQGASIHGGSGVACVACHQELAGTPDFPHAEQLEPAACAPCHADAQEAFEGSVHGYALSQGNPRAPSCASCHGAHDIVPVADPRSSVYRDKLPATCAACHGAARPLTREHVKLAQPFASYARSVHGGGPEQGRPVAATCADCHGAHDLRGADDPRSRISRAQIVTTCGRCHAAVRDEYDSSIHGLALAAGVGDSPSCVDCHGEHLILRADDPDSKTYARSLAGETCGRCHDDPVIVSKYGLRGGVVGSYQDSYHGWATRGGSSNAASCTSCHTAHAALPAEHPQSTIHPDNVLDTCRHCHKQANARFAASYTHEAVSITANPVNRWIRNVYVWLIAVVIGGMILHNAVILNYYVIEKRKRSEAGGWIRRLDLSQVLQHLALVVSFVALVVTGFALRYPEARWVSFLAALGMSEAVRASLHRVFAVVLLLVGFWHLYYVTLTRRGSAALRAILPSWPDLGQLVDNLRFHLWRRAAPVAFARYDYTQKVEYWALAWGTVVMAATGVVLWFPEETVRLIPSWAVTAAQTVHFYEAWLATLAVLVWHGFFVVIHPAAYPMSWTWLTGRMGRKEAREHHAGWYQEELAKAEATPQPPAEETPKE